MLSVYFLIVFILCILNSLIMINYARIFKIKQWFKGFYNIKKTLPQLSDFRTQEEYYLLGGWTTIKSITFFFLLLGVLTKWWNLFSLLIIIWIFFYSITKLLENKKLLSLILDLICQSILVIGLGFLSINYFHFGITF